MNIYMIGYPRTTWSNWFPKCKQYFPWSLSRRYILQKLQSGTEQNSTNSTK